MSNRRFGTAPPRRVVLEIIDGLAIGAGVAQIMIRPSVGYEMPAFAGIRTIPPAARAGLIAACDAAAFVDGRFPEFIPPTYDGSNELKIAIEVRSESGGNL